VEALEGRLLPTAYVVTTAKDILGDTTPGEVTLRDALTALDGMPSGNATVAGTAANTITFAIPGSGPHTIAVGSDPSAPGQALPAITRQVLLDGWSQGGSGYQGPPLIVLNGAHAGSGATGLVLKGGSDGSTVRGLVIQQFGGDGIDINGTRGNLIAGNYIGTDVTGTARLGNGLLGVWLLNGATANTVGGTAAGAGNVIAANGSHDLEMDQSSGNVVQGNFIGTDRTGTVGLGNGGGWDGVVIVNASAGNTVGGTAPGAGNVISDTYVGVFIFGTATTGNTVLGNLIGTDKSGTAPLGNSFGVAIGGGATGNVVGGTARGAGNVISANIYGVDLFQPGTSGNVVQGNLIGTDKSGTGRLGNATDGVVVEVGATGNVIGGTAPGSGNAIAFNGKGVVLIADATSGNSILGNSIRGNAGPGIDLGDDGPTPNGPNPRALPNGGQNAPVITGLTLHSISGSLSSVPRTQFRIEFFATPAGGPASQGQVFLGFLNVTTNAAGTVAFTLPVATLPLGTIVTATATNLSTGDTSEFSPVGTQLLILSNPAVVFSVKAQAITLSAQLFFGNAPVTGGVVVFRIAGVPGAVAGRVNANGVVTVSFVLPAATLLGGRAITATFLGTDAVPPAVGDGLLTITAPVHPLGRRV
jgi:hypothetical protein